MFQKRIMFQFEVICVRTYLEVPPCSSLFHEVGVEQVCSVMFLSIPHKSPAKRGTMFLVLVCSVLLVYQTQCMDSLAFCQIGILYFRRTWYFYYSKMFYGVSYTNILYGLYLKFVVFLIGAVLPDFAQVYGFIGSVFDPNTSGHLQKLKKMDPIDVETVSYVTLSL